MIERTLPSSESKLKIIRAIYENPDISVTGIIKSARISPNLAVKYVNELVGFGAADEVKTGGKKKTHQKRLRIKFSPIGKLLVCAIELDKKIIFLKKYEKLKPIIQQMQELFSGTDIEFCLIYGSFARLSADEYSDIDMIIVGKMSKEERDRLSEILSTAGREYSVEMESLRDFLKKAGEPLHKNIILEHVAVYGEREYVEALGRIQLK